MRLALADRMAFASTGARGHEPGRRAVVFIHGAGMDHSVWVMPARFFARHRMNVLALDLPGHGRTDGPALNSIPRMADWVSEAMTAAEIDSAAIVGHSMGALVAYAFAVLHGRRCRSLALLGVSAPMPVSAALLDAARDNDHAAIDMANAWSFSARAQLGASQNPGMWMLGAGKRLLERAAPGVFHADLTACNQFDAEALGGKVTCPSLVIVGGSDQMTPANAGRKVAERLPDAETVMLPGCGHTMLSEAPNLVLDALAGLLRPGRDQEASDA